MAKPLHDIEVLVSLAEGPAGLAQAWGASRLAVIAPDRFERFPSGQGPQEVVLAANPPGCVPALVEALDAARPCPAELAATAATLGVFGALPENRAPLTRALREARRGDGHEADLWLAFALTTLDAVQPRDLAAAAQAESPDRYWLLPVIVLRVAEVAGHLDDAADEVARTLSPERARNALTSILAALGTPIGPDFADHRAVDAAVRFGAAQAGRDAPTPPSRRGSRKRRVQGAVLGLLEGVEGPPAALLRAVYRDGADLAWGLAPVAIAAWLASFVPDDPVTDVLEHRGGADPTRLTRAREAIDATRRGAILTALGRCPDASASVLAMPRVVAGDTELAEAVLRQIVDAPWYDHRIDALANVAAWHAADVVPGLLDDRTTRDLGLLAAEWTPTVEVLEALLSLPVPADIDPRVQYAQSLAAMGDPAVVPQLAALLEHDEAGELAQPCRLAETLLNVAIG